MASCSSRSTSSLGSRSSGRQPSKRSWSSIARRWIWLMTERRGSFPFPDVPQAIAFHQLLMQRLGIGELDSPDENRLRSTLDRAHSTVQHQRGDVVTLASFLLFGLIRD